MQSIEGVHVSQTEALRAVPEAPVVAAEVTTHRGPALGEEEQCQEAKRGDGEQHAFLCKLRVKQSDDGKIWWRCVA